MKGTKFKSVTFSNKTKEIDIVYTSGKSIIVHYGLLGISKNIKNIEIDKETGKKSLAIEYLDGTFDFLPYDQPFYVVRDPEYMLQNHIENIIAEIKEVLSQKKISKKFLARQLKTSDNQIQRLLNPNILNKNLTQLYKLAHLISFEFHIHLKAV